MNEPEIYIVFISIRDVKLYKYVSCEFDRDIFVYVVVMARFTNVKRLVVITPFFVLWIQKGHDTFFGGAGIE